jgi:electron transfer flavoprotein alpha subunit
MCLIALVAPSNGELSSKDLSLISYAAESARILCLSCAVLSLGDLGASAETKLMHAGIQELYCPADPRVNLLQTNACTGFILYLMKLKGCSVLIASHEASWLTIVSQVSVKSSAALLLNACSLPLNDKAFHVRQHLSFTNIVRLVKTQEPIKILTVSPAVFTARQVAPMVYIKHVIEYIPDAGDLIRVEQVKESKRHQLSDAEVIVAGGQSLNSAGDWELLQALAGELNAAVGCTKPVVEQGWRDAGDCIGQDGVSVAPNLYIAVGISGAPHHIAGMKYSKKILAINTDENAPIFKIADFGIVGDVRIVLPRLISQLRSLKLTDMA